MGPDIPDAVQSFWPCGPPED